MGFQLHSLKLTAIAPENRPKLPQKETSNSYSNHPGFQVRFVRVPTSTISEPSTVVMVTIVLEESDHEKTYVKGILKGQRWVGTYTPSKKLTAGWT